MNKDIKSIVKLPDGHLTINKWDVRCSRCGNALTPSVNADTGIIYIVPCDCLVRQYIKGKGE